MDSRLLSCSYKIFELGSWQMSENQLLVFGGVVFSQVFEEESSAGNYRAVGFQIVFESPLQGFKGFLVFLFEELQTYAGTQVWVNCEGFTLRFL